MVLVYSFVNQKNQNEFGSVELGLKHERGCKHSILVNESKYAGIKCRLELFNFSFDDDEKKLHLISYTDFTTYVHIKCQWT